MCGSYLKIMTTADHIAGSRIHDMIQAALDAARAGRMDEAAQAWSRRRKALDRIIGLRKPSLFLFFERARAAFKRSEIIFRSCSAREA